MGNTVSGSGSKGLTTVVSVRTLIIAIIMALMLALTVSLTGCGSKASSEDFVELGDDAITDKELSEDELAAIEAEEQELAAASAAEERKRSADELYAQLSITQDFRPSFVHGQKGAEFQKYIVLHDTEGNGSASGVIDWWDSNGNLIAAHFVVNKDGTIVQAAPLDAIVHHAGFGNTGHNAQYGVTDESRDDKLGTKPIGSSFADYGMNSYSIGIEMVHVGGSGPYPEAQLEAVDALIAYIDAYYGMQSQIIDHKEWRSGNSDTSSEFAPYLANYKATRTHNGA